LMTAHCPKQADPNWKTKQVQQEGDARRQVDPELSQVFPPHQIRIAVSRYVPTMNTNMEMVRGRVGRSGRSLRLPIRKGNRRNKSPARKSRPIVVCFLPFAREIDKFIVSMGARLLR